MVLLANRCIFIIENPSSSLIYRHWRFEQLCNHIAYVREPSVYLKPPLSACLGLQGSILDGPLGRAYSKEDCGLEQRPYDPSARCREDVSRFEDGVNLSQLDSRYQSRWPVPGTYVDSNGAKRFQGKKKEMRESQTLVSVFDP